MPKFNIRVLQYIDYDFDVEANTEAEAEEKALAEAEANWEDNPRTTDFSWATKVVEGMGTTEQRTIKL
jgi:hypothetical protein